MDMDEDVIDEEIRVDNMKLGGDGLADVDAAK